MTACALYCGSSTWTVLPMPVSFLVTARLCGFGSRDYIGDSYKMKASFETELFESLSSSSLPSVMSFTYLMFSGLPCLYSRRL